MVLPPQSVLNHEPTPATAQGCPPDGLADVTSPDVKAFIERAISFDPALRPNAAELLQDPFLQSSRNIGERSGSSSTMLRHSDSSGSYRPTGEEDGNRGTILAHQPSSRPQDGPAPLQIQTRPAVSGPTSPNAPSPRGNGQLDGVGPLLIKGLWSRADPVAKLRMKIPDGGAAARLYFADCFGLL